MRTTILIAMSALSTATVPAVAQDAMMKKDNMAAGQMKMSSAETRKMRACNAMSHDRMMKDAGCTRMMKMHPAMMKGDSMTKSDGMMKKGS